MIAALVVVAILLQAQAPDSGSGAALRRSAWKEMEALERRELGAGRARTPSTRDTVDHEAKARVLLDTLVLQSPAGRAELDALRGAWPASALIDEYDARFELRAGRYDAALGRVEGLIRRRPEDPELQRLRGEALRLAGRRDDAMRAYALVLELRPDDESFRTLVALCQDSTDLERVLTQVRRLRVRRPDSSPLGEHEVELLQRLGRSAEASRIARANAERTP